MARTKQTAKRSREEVQYNVVSVEEWKAIVSQPSLEQNTINIARNQLKNAESVANLFFLLEEKDEKMGENVITLFCTVQEKFYESLFLQIKSITPRAAKLLSTLHRLARNADMAAHILDLLITAVLDEPNEEMLSHIVKAMFKYVRGITVEKVELLLGILDKIVQTKPKIVVDAIRVYQEVICEHVPNLSYQFVVA